MAQQASNTGYYYGQHSTLEPVEYSGLEAVPQNPGLEVVPQQNHPLIPVEPGNAAYAQPGWAAAKQEEDASPPAEPQQKILGLSVKRLWIIVVILVVLLIAAIGGGVGGGLAARNRADSGYESSSSTGASETGTTATPTTTGTGTSTTSSTSTTATSTVAAINVGCPAKNGTTYTAVDSSGNKIQLKDGKRPMSFVRLCNTNYPGGLDNGSIQDLQKVSSTASMEDCIAACAAYNVANYGTMETCENAVMDISLGNSDCFLKSGHGRNVTNALSSKYEAASLVDLGLE